MSSRRSKSASKRKRSTRSIGNVMMSNTRIWALLKILIFATALVWTWVTLDDVSNSASGSGIAIKHQSRSHAEADTFISADEIRNIFVVVYVLSIMKVMLKGFGGSNALMKMMETGENWVRWLDSFVTLPFIMLLVALFCGVESYSSLLMIVSLTIVYTMVGTFMEFIGSKAQIRNSRGVPLRSMSLIPPLVQIVAILGIWYVIYLAWSNLTAPPDYINLVFYSGAVANISAFLATFMWYYGYAKAMPVGWVHEGALWIWKLVIPFLIASGLSENEYP